MKINPSQDTTLGSKAAATPATDRVRSGEGAASKTADVGTPDSGASVRLSDLSTQLHALESSLAAGSEFDAGKVEAIKQAIRDGTLSVNAEVVSDRMLAGLRDLFAKGH